MLKGDAICHECGAGFRRIELTSIEGRRGEFHCPVCQTLIEAWDGRTEVAYRLTIQPSMRGFHEP
jgi:hypothetical protein